VLEEAAIKVLPAKLAKGSLGKHYRIGWDEQQKAGGSLLEEKNIIDLPDRMPEGMKLPGHFDPGSSGVVVPSAPPGMSASPMPISPVAPVSGIPPGMPGATAGRVPSHPPGLGGAQ
jgi:ferredoxin-type protein NapG